MYGDGTNIYWLFGVRICEPKDVQKKVQKELTERQLIILRILLSDNSITLDQMSKRIYCITQDDAQDEVLVIAMSLREHFGCNEMDKDSVISKMETTANDSNDYSD